MCPSHQMNYSCRVVAASRGHRKAPSITRGGSYPSLPACSAITGPDSSSSGAQSLGHIEQCFCSSVSVGGEALSKGHNVKRHGGRSGKNQAKTRHREVSVALNMFHAEPVAVSTINNSGLLIHKKCPPSPPLSTWWG